MIRREVIHSLNGEKEEEIAGDWKIDDDMKSMTSGLRGRYDLSMFLICPSMQFDTRLICVVTVPREVMRIKITRNDKN